ncbi:MAG: endolytic transglycosylase MltG [Lachnospiraceae bacterium]|nr:endolytic transglycosylase MltG [Lachnospiraceae bacterium]
MRARRVAWSIVRFIFGLVISIVIMMLVYRFALDAYDFGYRIFAETPVSPEPGLTMSVAIVEGKSVMEIGEILEGKGLIRDAYLFYLTEMFSTYHKKLQPGVYELSTAMTPEEMMGVMAANATEELEEEEISGNSEESSDLADTEMEEDSDEENSEGGDAEP